MANINEMMDCLKKRAEESIDHYAKKTDWKQEDLEMACAAVKLYDKACDVQMKEGIWDEMKGDGGTIWLPLFHAHARTSHLLRT